MIRSATGSTFPVGSCVYDEPPAVRIEKGAPGHVPLRSDPGDRMKAIVHDAYGSTDVLPLFRVDAAGAQPSHAGLQGHVRRAGRRYPRANAFRDRESRVVLSAAFRGSHAWPDRDGAAH